MTCPKCSGAMRTYERNGVGRQPAGGAAPAGPAAGSVAGGAGLGAVVDEVLGQVRGSKQPRYDDRRYDEHGRSYGYGHPRRKKSFLSELFD